MFSDKLKKLRKSQNLTQEELGKIICVSRSAVAKWEQGKGIPNKQSIVDICTYFKISKEDLFDEDDKEIVISNLEKENKRSKKSNILFIILIFVLLTIIFLLLFLPKKDRVVENSFFENDTLEKYNLQSLKSIEFEKAICVNEEKFGAQISNEEIFNDYTEYVFNYLQSAPNISRVSFLTTAPTKDDMNGSSSYFLVPSNNISDFKIDPRINSYDFYFIIDFPDGHKKKEAVEVIHLSIQYDEDGTYLYYNNFEEHYDGNFLMVLEKCNSKNEEYYLIEEYYEYSKIKIDNDNVLDYFYIDVNDFSVKAVTTKYVFFANVNMRLDITITDYKQNEITHEFSRHFFVETYVQFARFFVVAPEFNLDSFDGWEIVDIKVFIEDDSFVYFVP